MTLYMGVRAYYGKSICDVMVMFVAQTMKVNIHNFPGFVTIFIVLKTHE